MKARLRAYAYWQLRDFVFERAAAIIIVGLVLVFGVHESLGAGAERLFAAGGREAYAFGARAVAQHVTFLWFMTSLIAIHGISANDRTTGRFRLIFAKPVRVLPYYAQAFVIHGAVFMTCVAIAVAVFTRLFPVNGQVVGAALILFAVSYLLVGGVCFLFSAIWRFDWLSTGVILGLATWLASGHPGARWLYPLPPTWIIIDQGMSIEKLRPLEPKPLLWVIAYGVACFLLGLILLKRRPLAT